MRWVRQGRREGRKEGRKERPSDTAPPWQALVGGRKWITADTGHLLWDSTACINFFNPHNSLMM